MMRTENPINSAKNVGSTWLYTTTNVSDVSTQRKLMNMLGRTLKVSKGRGLHATGFPEDKEARLVKLGKTVTAVLIIGTVVLACVYATLVALSRM